MGDLISRQRLLSVVKPMVGVFEDDGFYLEYESVISAIENAPTIEPKRGKWVKKMEVIKTEKFEAFTPKWYCPSCGKEYDPAAVKAVGIKFCYECGARVEE